MFVRRNATPLVPVLLSVVLLTAGCAGQDDAKSSPESPSSSITPHGYVEGATEAAEQQSRLLLGDPGTGDTRVLDLITGKTHDSARRAGVTELTTDGRFGYFHGTDGTHVLDSGAWTVDHGDHVHYYRAQIQEVGDIPGGTGTSIRSDAGVTVVTKADGKAGVYPRTDLEQGALGAPDQLPGTYAAPVVPYAEHLITLTRDGDAPAKVVVLDRSGKRVATPESECEDPKGDAVTRRGIVLGCADGALLVHEDDETFTAEKIPYGEDVPKTERATDFRHRPGSATLTALAGKDAVRVLDVTERAWTRVDTGPVVAANTGGEGSPLVVLETDGALHGYDMSTGEETTVTERLLKDIPEPTTGRTGTPVIEVDRSRAYLNDPAGKRVYEIDYNDDLRVARTFDLDVRPSLMVETGR
ncbi:lipoprotein [Streptomyces marokkonensis]|uniref:Lipoprotein n=1 Tax=Streptomyces marokkonensis TaxID=324855 RepID=A0ABP7R209_9ACTN